MLLLLSLIRNKLHYTLRITLDAWWATHHLLNVKPLLNGFTITMECLPAIRFILIFHIFFHIF
jgi:hypothetical protein